MILTGRVLAEVAGERLDNAVRALFPQLSKTHIRRLVEWGACTVNGLMVRVASRPLKVGDEITLGVLETDRFVDLSYESQDMLYEDGNFLAINKESGYNSQRTPYQFRGTVEYAVGAYLQTLGSTSPVMTVHRLDRATSGVMIFPKNKKAAAHISAQLKATMVEKVYWALVRGEVPEENWCVDAPIGKVGKSRYGVMTPGKAARTDFCLLSRGDGVSFLEARPYTGRTHQIRVHLSHCGFPIVGDRTYGGMPAVRMLLHCRSMAFETLAGKIVRVVAPPDAPFAALCAKYGIDIAPLLG